MDIFIDTLQDTYFMIPVLFIMYLGLEYFEHKEEKTDIKHYLTHCGPLVGAFLGLIPQCGMSIVGSLLFIENKISLGTLISIFIATSDEAIPLLLTTPRLYPALIQLIVLKLILAIAVGYAVDKWLNHKPFTIVRDEAHCHHDHSLILAALKRTMHIYLFIFIINSLLSFLIIQIGENNLSSVLLNQSLLQPVIAALFGFIPNCAATLIITQLFATQVISFASLFASLVTNTGLGLLVLQQNKIGYKTILIIISILFMSSLFIAIPLQWMAFT